MPHLQAAKVHLLIKKIQKGSVATVGLKQDLGQFSHLQCLYLFSTLKELDIKQSGYDAAECLEELRGPMAPQQELKFVF